MIEENINLGENYVSDDNIGATSDNNLADSGGARGGLTETLRDQIKNAFGDITEKKGEKERARNPDGKFAKSSTNLNTENNSAENSSDESTDNKVQQNTIVKAPDSWSQKAKEKWSTLDAEIQQEISKRELDIHKKFTSQNEDLIFSKNIKNVIAPYESMIRSEGVEPAVAINNLLQTAAALRSADPNVRIQMIHQIANDFGIDLKSSNQPRQQPEITGDEEYLDYVAPEVKRALDEIRQFNKIREQEEFATKQARLNAAQQEVENFKVDKPHFDKVRNLMASFFQNGQASNLQEAYDMACWSDPEVRSMLLEKEKHEKEAKLLEEIKSKAESAKKASISLNGSPGFYGRSNSNVNENESLRDSLRNALNQYSNSRI